VNGVHVFIALRVFESLVVVAFLKCFLFRNTSKYLFIYFLNFIFDIITSKRFENIKKLILTNLCLDCNPKRGLYLQHRYLIESI